MKPFDTIYATAKIPPPVKKGESKAPLYYFYKALQVVLSFWIVTVMAIITQPWLDYWAKSQIKNVTLSGSEGSPANAGTGTVAGDSSQAQNDAATFSLKNSQVEIKAPIVEGIDEASLKQGIGHHSDSRWPDQKGNVVLAGHSSDLDAENPFREVFNNLRKVDINDEVIIEYQGKKYHYQVFKKETVSPKDESLFGQMDDWILTFYTCDPPYTDWKRLVLQAKLERIE